MSFNGWRTYYLDDVCTITDCLHKTAPAVNYVTPYKMLRTSNIRNGEIDAENVKYVTEDTYKKWSIRGKLEINDVILTREAPMGEVGIIKTNDKFFLGQRMLQLKAKTDVITPDFLYYALQSRELQNQIKMQEGTGSVVSNIRIPLLKKFTITLPENIEQQESITRLLRNMDNKIKLNNDIISCLEEMAQTIFKRWFVEFEFPNDEGVPFKSSGGKLVESELGLIPEDWGVVSGEEVFISNSGYSYKGKELCPSNSAMVTIKNFSRNGGFKFDGLKEIILSEKVKPHHYVEIGDVVVAHTDLTQNAEIIGNPIIIYSNGGYEKLITSMDTVKVASKDNSISNKLIYLILKEKRFKNFALGWTNGTTVLHLSKKAINNYKFTLPNNKEEVKRLQAIFDPIFNQFSVKFNENKTLKELRDTLLHKLMTGEIGISDSKEEVEECLQKSN